PLVFTLASGTPPGVYAVSYTATVTASSGTVGNNVVISGGGGDPTPDCGSCTTSHPLGDPSVSVAKTSNPSNGSTVVNGETITYTRTATVTDAELGAELVLEDTLGAGLAFGSVTAPRPSSSTLARTPLVFTLASGTPPGVYAVSYTATVTASSGTVGNNVVISGGGGDPTPDC